MTWLPSVGPMTRSFTVLAWSCTSAAMMKASSRSGHKSLRPPRVTMANHSRRSSPVTIDDFYAVDPLLFSPAEVVFQNLETGRSHAFGRVETDILARSFWG